MRPVERLSVVPEEPGWLGKYPFSRVRWSREGPGFCFGRWRESLRQEVVLRRTMSAGGIVFKLLTMYQPGGASGEAELAQLPGGAEGEWQVHFQLSLLRNCLGEVIVASKPEEKGPKVKSMRKVCGFFAGGRGCKMGKNCNYSHDWSAIDRKADRCWICGSLQHRKGECPVKHEAAGRAGTKQGGESQPQQQQQSQQQKPKVAAEKGVVEERRHLDSGDSMFRSCCARRRGC